MMGQNTAKNFSIVMFIVQIQVGTKDRREIRKMYNISFAMPDFMCEEVFATIKSAFLITLSLLGG